LCVIDVNDQLRRRQPSTASRGGASDDQAELEAGSSGNEELQQCAPQQPSAKRRRRVIVDTDSDSDSGSMMRHSAEHSQPNKIRARKSNGVRVPWSDHELNIIRYHFREYLELENRKPPNFQAIEAARATYNVLQKRTREQIKTRVWHMIKTGR